MPHNTQSKAAPSRAVINAQRGVAAADPKMSTLTAASPQQANSLQLRHPVLPVVDGSTSPHIRRPLIGHTLVEASKAAAIH